MSNYGYSDYGRSNYGYSDYGRSNYGYSDYNSSSKNEGDIVSTLVGLVISAAFLFGIVKVQADIAENKNYENPAIVRVNDDNENFAAHKKVFGPEEHTISNFVLRPKQNVVTQYPAISGYKVIGMDIDTGGCLLIYTNDELVVCESTGIIGNGEYAYTDFGTPDRLDDQVQQISGYHIFEANEHILLVPVSDPRIGNIQYLDIDGYELVDVAFYESGKYSDYSGSWALYTNKVPVKCVETDGEYLEFGEPIVLEKEEGKILTR